MKLECPKEKFEQAVSMAERITGKNLTLPVLKCVFFEAKGKGLKLKATNLDLGIEIDLPAKITENGSAAVPGSILYSFITSLPKEVNISIESSKENIKLSTVSTSTVIKTYPFEDFPVIPRVDDGISVKINTKDFISGLKSVWWSAAVSSMKPELSSVYVYSDGVDMVFVATDSFRLAERRMEVKKTGDFGDILIPVKNIPDIIKVLESVDGEVDVVVSKNQISFTQGGVYLVSRVIDGVFPDYKQLIPKDHKTEAVILKQDLLNTLKLASVFSDKFNQINFKVNPDTKTLKVTTKNSEIGESVNSIEAALSGDLVDINIVHKYISDSFQTIDSDSLSLQFNGYGHPVVIRGVSNKSFTYIVMPMNK